MRSFDHSFSSSPVDVLMPQHPQQPSYNMDMGRPTFSGPFSNGIQQSPETSSWSHLAPSQSTPRSAAGRKRSRDEAATNLEEDYFPVQAPLPPPEEEWEYGEGMVLMKKGGSGYIIEASSQTGTWAEEKAAEEAAQAAALTAVVPERPVLRAAKSQRLNLSATPAIPEEVLCDGVATSPGSPERHTEPTVDDFTRHLGIGWSSLSNADVDIQVAARGWAKFIENHFPVTDVRIGLQSKGLASYLVQANEGYFLFGEDLKQGRLVSTSLEQTWVNLKSPVPIFDGDLIMEAGQTPKIDAVAEAMVIGENLMNEETTNGGNMMAGLNVVGVANGINHPANGAHMTNEMMNGVHRVDTSGAPPTTMEVEMDMS